MKITRIDTWPIPLKLKEPYSISYETYDFAINIMMRMETSTGIVAWGCAAPDPHVTGESIDRTIGGIQDATQEMLLYADPLMPLKRLEQFKKKVKNAPSAIAMVDMALIDLVGKVAGLPVYKILGGYRRRMMTSVTIGILSVQDTVEKARDFVARGFKALKIKGGKDVGADIERIRKVREAVGHKIRLRFDANQGYTEQEALDFLTGIKNTRLQLFEQPVARNRLNSLGRINNKTQVPVMADESLVNLKDAIMLAKMNPVGLVNIKLMKVGGIYEALKINSVVSAAGIKAMVGCMDETALSISAGLHFALSQPNVHYVDLDSHLNLDDDPTTGAIKLKNGLLYPIESPGLGFDV